MIKNGSKGEWGKGYDLKGIFPQAGLHHDLIPDPIGEMEFSMKTFCKYRSELHTSKLVVKSRLKRSRQGPLPDDGRNQILLKRAIGVFVTDQSSLKLRPDKMVRDDSVKRIIKIYLLQNLTCCLVLHPVYEKIS